jgi:hypothetical protein
VQNTRTEDLSDEEILNMTILVSDGFEIDEEDVLLNIIYVTEGSIALIVPESTSDNDIIEAVTESLSSILDIHPSTFVVTSVDPSSGLVSYEIQSDSYVEASNVQSRLYNMTVADIESAIGDSLPGVQIEESSVLEDIEVQVVFTLDGSTTPSVKESKDRVADDLSDLGFEVVTNVAIVTRAPSSTPIVDTSIPSSSPSITGLVVTMVFSSTDRTLNETDLINLSDDVANAYGVEADDVHADAIFIISGDLDLSHIPDDLSSEDVVDILESEIADVLGIHSGNVDVHINEDTGDASYTVTVSSSDAANTIQDAIVSEDFVDELNAKVSDELLGVSIISVNTDGEVEMHVTVTIDATSAENDVDDVTTQIVEDFEQSGYSSFSEVSFITPKPSMSPIHAPTSEMPSTMPSMTGIVASFEVTVIVTKSLKEEEVDDITEEVIRRMNVTEDDIETSGTYICVF